MGRINAYHLLTQPETAREKKSIASISPLGDLRNISYSQVINDPYTDFPPKDSCMRPEDIGMEPGLNSKTNRYRLTPAHYGCYRAHGDLIMSLPEDTNDIYLIFECDAELIIPHFKFKRRVKKANKLSLKQDYTFFSFGAPIGKVIQCKGHKQAAWFMEAHAYIIPGRKVSYVKEILCNSGWDVFDIWVTSNFGLTPAGYFNHPSVIQGYGYSLLEKKEVVKYPPSTRSQKAS